MTACNLAELPAWATQLLVGARVAHLGLDYRGLPRVLPVIYALTEGRISSAVDESADTKVPVLGESPAAGPVIAIEPQRCLCWHASAG
ncbi:MAG: hypothetical protein M3076_14530 [Actinomycetota bacterium]|nr:hypothetical protein [Actinomycetota bacterium]